MKNRMKRKVQRKKRAHPELFNYPVFEMLVNSLCETRDEERLVFMLQYSNNQ